MTRYILVDNASGYIWSDLDADDPVHAARKTDGTVDKEFGYDYTEYRPGCSLASDDSAYLVYTVPSDYPSFSDGSARAEIDALDAQGTLVAIVQRHVSDDE
jgi:hypothetical protein